MITREGGHLALGITLGGLGLLLLSMVFQYFELFPSWESPLFGAIIGGFIAGAVALGSQIIVIIDGIRRVREERFESNKAIAQSLMIKLTVALDRVLKTHNYYRTYDNSAVVSLFLKNVDSGELFPKAQFWKPLESKKKEISVGHDEKLFALSGKHLALFNQLSDLEGMLLSCDFLQESYERAFKSFQAKQFESGKVNIRGKEIDSESDSDELGLMELLDFLEKLRSILVKTLPIVNSATAEIQEILKDEFKITIEFDYEVDSSGAADF